MNKPHRGFTLIELLVVVAIIAMIASIILASFSSAQAKARDARRLSNFYELRSALELYYSKHNAYPWCTDWTQTQPYWINCLNTALIGDGDLQIAIDDPQAPTQHYVYDNFCVDPPGTNVQHYRLWGRTELPQSAPNGTALWWSANTAGVTNCTCPSAISSTCL